MSEVSKMKVKKYYINLDRRADRRKEFEKKCPWEDVERISAVDGRELHIIFKESARYRRMLHHAVYYGYTKPVKPGNIGASLSHLATWKKIVESQSNSNNDVFLIMEDDCFFSERISVEWDCLLRQLENIEFDIVYPGGRFTENFSPDNIAEWTHVRKNIYLRSNKVSRPEKSVGMDWDRTGHAYLVSKKFCMFLVDHSIDILKLPIDHWIAAKCVLNNRTALDYFPHLMYVPRDYKSDIQSRDGIFFHELHKECRLDGFGYTAFRIKNRVMRIFGCHA